MTHARAAIEGATEALVRRTSFRKAGLAPWDPRVQQTWLYTLAGAAEATRMDVNHTVLVVNHQHTMVTTRDVPMPSFLSRLHQPMSRAMNALLKRCGFDPFDRFWDGRQAHRMRLLDAAAQMSQLVYHQVQACAAGLVDDPSGMPGWTFHWDLWRPGRFVRIERPDIHFDPRYSKDHYDLNFVPPPLLLELFEGNLDKLIYRMKQLEKEAVTELRAHRRKERRKVRGPERVKQIHPWDEPRTAAESGGRIIPTFRIGAKGMVGKQARGEACAEVNAFRTCSRESFKEWKDGNRDVVFPYGTDKMNRLHGVNAENSPGPDALVFAPGPSLEEVQESYANSRHNPLSDEARDVAEAVCAALREEAPSFEEFSETIFGRTSRSGSASAAVVVPGAPSSSEANATSGRVASDAEVDLDLNRPGAPRPQGVATQTLEGPRRVSRSHPPARIVVKRSRRGSGKQTSDPPQG